MRARALRASALVASAWIASACSSEPSDDSIRDVGEDSVDLSDAAVAEGGEPDALVGDAPPIAPGDVGPSADGGSPYWYKGPKAAPGTIGPIDLRKATGVEGRVVALPGNPSTPATAFDPLHSYVAFLGKDEGAYVAMRDGDKWTARRLDVSPVIDNASHGAPSIHIDGRGFLSFTYIGKVTSPLPLANPVLRRSEEPLEPKSWSGEKLGLLYNTNETSSVALPDGDWLWVGSDIHARVRLFDVKTGAPDASPDWQYPRQVVSSKFRDRPWPTAPATSCVYEGNRFTKTMMEWGGPIEPAQKTPYTLYALWGWGGTGDRADDVCNDIRYYTEDHHEAHFAYSVDGGITWKNKAGSKQVRSAPCPTPDDCSNKDVAIAYSDAAYRVSRTRKSAFHRIFIDESSGEPEVFIVFAKSGWCDASSTVTRRCDARSVTNPYALVLVRFKLGTGEASEVALDLEPHTFIGSVYVAGGELFVEAIRSAGYGDDRTFSARAFEYRAAVTKTGLGPVTRRQLIDATAGRMLGAPRIPQYPSLHVAIEASESDGRHIYYYGRNF